MRKNGIRTLLFLLTLCIMMTAFSCKTKDENTVDNSTEETKDTNYLDTLPTLDLEGAEFKILITDQVKDFYDQSTVSGDKVDSVCYQRNAVIEDHFDTKLVYNSMDGNYLAADEFATKVRTTTMSGEENSYDLIIGQSYYCLPLVSEGCYHDLAQSKNMNWDEQWYHKNINECGTVNGKLWGASGSYVISQLSYATALFFSKDIYLDFGFEYDLYQLVRDKQWTYEKFLEIVNTVESQFNENDPIYAYNNFDHGRNALVVSLGVEYFATDPDTDMPTLDGMDVNHIQDIYDLLHNLFREHQSVTLDTVALEKLNNALKFDRFLFDAGYVHGLILDPEAADMVGILPSPMLDSNQDDYRVRIMRDELFYIPSAVDMETSAILVEALNYTTYTMVNPVYWDSAMELRTAKTPEDREMLELIASKVYFGFEGYFSCVLQAGAEGQKTALRFAISTQLEEDSGSFSTWWAKHKRQIEDAMTEIYEIYG